MRHFKIHTKLVVVAFAASAAIASSSSADVFRGVRADPNTGVVHWDAENFRVTSTLSFFSSEQQVAEKLGGVPDCFIQVALPNPAIGDYSVGQNVAPQLQIMHGGAPQNFTANFPWPIVNDNFQTGHWSILGDTILEGILPNFYHGNNLASNVAAAGFRYLALAQNDPQVTVISGTNPNCSAQ
jgi:hypothetical protein